MLERDERRVLIELSLQKSQDKLNASKDFCDVHPAEAVSAAYYSVFHAVQALFLQDGLVSTKKRGHRSVVALFNREYVYPGIFLDEMKRILGQLESIRNKSDYEPQMQITAPQAEECIVKAEKFNAAIRTYVREQQQKEARQATDQTQNTQEQTAQINKADLHELESATALLKNPRALDNATFRGYEIPLQQNDTLDLLEQVRDHIQKDRVALAKLENSGLTLDSIAKNKIVRPGQFPNLRDANVLARTKDSLVLVRGRSLYIYELKKLELKAPAQGVPGEKLSLKWPTGRDKAQASHSQERGQQQQHSRRQSRDRGDGL